MSARASAALLAAALLVAAPSADAQTGDKAAAESLFQAGVALMNQGKFVEACPKFVESQAADPSSGTLLNLGSCYERTGKTASAWATYKEAAVLARKLGQTDREAVANGRIAELEPRLSRLRIDAGDVPGQIIKRDGYEVGRGSLGIPIAVDPGDHVISATAPGYVDWSTPISVGDNADSKTVTVPPLQKKAVDVVLPPEEPPAANATLRTAGFITGGVGVAALGVGAVFGILAVGDKSDADPLCPENRCKPDGYDLIEAASTKAWVSTIGIGVGVAAVGAGTALLLLSRPSKSDSARRGSSFATVIVPSADPHGGGLTIAGFF